MGAYYVSVTILSVLQGLTANPNNKPWNGYCSYSSFVDEETKAQS